MTAQITGRSPLRSAAELEEIAAAGIAELGIVNPTKNGPGRDADAADVIAWAAATFGPTWALTASMQDTVLAHLVARVAPGTDVLFLETGYHFAETLATRDAVRERYAVNVIDLRAEQTPAEQDEAYGADLFASNPDLCCLLRKETPLDEAMENYEAWATGLRRAEAVTRAGTRQIAFDARRQRVKIAPLAGWSDADVAAYVAEHDVIVNPLVAQGYPSIGCAPCTRKVLPGEDARAGRWAGTAKIECGIHR
ncbi:phosphoadenosine phosphosulfate reductase [Kineosphaera limosa]|uniref:Adenosine 5'-phosphosulfate reductase n=1 Tax=Kineosphaera limosa NBRC 100340 TaxID=1184609 RepID=K6XE75_9MICO|nr:phosphoadenylyl-sulfate reductase [Kineosphaera limosa]NYE00336.1 phosphoadenosine phosphosulfate reductase [Kineosphaera limosa]GAB97134.1 adenosine 5'-phosphosulfate reductase [Kineosphaera limosa NBRC 100340]